MKLHDPGLFRQQGFVDGQWTDARDGATLTIQNPANGAVIGTVPRFGSEETALAIEAAQRAFPAWSKLTPLERGQILRRWHDLVVENLGDLAVILVTEQGKPLAEARGEILTGSPYLLWYAEEARRAYGTVIPSPWPGKQPLTVRQPIGVSAAITPWNFPMSMILRKVAPALAAGCPMIVKPASLTPFSALALAELARRAGIPDGVLSVLTGSATAIGEVLCNSPIVRKLTFTGSTEVGKSLIAACASTVKKLSMELGGNAPMIICPDADIDQAVAGAMACKFRNAGQTCICANRIIVHESIHDVFVAKLVDKVAGMVLGNGLERGVTQGPLIDRAALHSVASFVEDALHKGARKAAGGKLHSLGGLFYEPTVLTGVTSEMRVFQEEIFGPVAPVLSYQTEEQAVAMANDTAYGLASYVYTKDMATAYRISMALEYGMVGVNDVTLASSEVPFGGVKESGFGREGGAQGMDDYLETKYILLGNLG